MPKSFSAYKGTARCYLAITKIRAGESLTKVSKILRCGFRSRVGSRCNITTVSGAPEENTSETVSGASAPTAEKTDVDIQTTTGKESAGFRRKKIALPDFERTFFAPVDCRNRSAIYVSARTKCKVSAILHLLGHDNTRLTALADNMLRFVMDIYRDELNYLHEKKNKRRPF